MPQANYSLKDMLFNRETITELSDAIEKVYEEFHGTAFVEMCLKGFDGRELKERMSFVRECLELHLPKDYLAATEVMLKACEVTTTTGQFPYGAFCEYVEINGCDEVYLAHSLKMLGAYTKILSAEFAIRTFINRFPEETFQMMLKWAQSEDVDQRRLASEGLRAKLPWAKGIAFDPIKATVPLEHLFYDEERYVTRSVANHLNDLSKLHPEAVVDLLTKWQSSGRQRPKEMAYIIGHSTRTLIKKGHPSAFQLLGYPENPKIEVGELMILTPQINLGETLVFECIIRAEEDTNLIIDYEVDYPMANNKRSSKIFKIKKCTLKKGEEHLIQKKHPFKLMTTKKLYTGDYKVQVQINGKQYSEGSFHLMNG